MVNNPNIMYYKSQKKHMNLKLECYYIIIIFYMVYSKYNNEKCLLYHLSLFIEKSINNVKNNLYVCNNIDNIKILIGIKVWRYDLLSPISI